MSEQWIRRPHTQEEIRDLLTTVKNLEVPNALIDARIAFAFGWKHLCATNTWGIGAPHWYLNERSLGEILGPLHYVEGARLPNFTASIDTALTIIPVEYSPCINFYSKTVEITKEATDYSLFEEYSSLAKNVPCAIVAIGLEILLAKMRRLKEGVVDHG